MKKMLSKKNNGYFLLFLFLLCSCKSNRSKGKYASTVQICNQNLYIETYTIFGSGAYGGDRVSDYLTDSLNFKMYVGTYDNADEGFSYVCKGDSVKIYKVKGIRENRNKIVRTLTYSLSDLKKKKIFE